MDDWIQYAEELKRDLPPFDSLDPLYLLAIIDWKVPIGFSGAEKSILQELGNPDEWEFVGDAVIHIIITTMLTEERLTVAQLTEVRSLLERNLVLTL